MSFPDDVWEDPRYADFKAKRDEGLFIYDYEIAHKLFGRHSLGEPLNLAERTYLVGFMNSNICQQFFCRLGLTFRNNSPCWLRGVPTPEQCDRCEQHFTLKTAIDNWHKIFDPIKEVENNQVVGMFGMPDKDGILRFEWKVVPDVATFKGMLGIQFNNINALNLGTPLNKAFPVCLPSLSKTFKGGCDQQCDKCPAHALVDFHMRTVHTDKGQVTIDFDSLKVNVRQDLEAMYDQAKKEMMEVHERGEQRDDPEPPAS